jgi:hypothetical protein
LTSRQQKHVTGDSIEINVAARTVVSVRRAGRVIRSGSFAQTPEGKKQIHH